MKNLKVLKISNCELNERIFSTCPSFDYNDGLYCLTENSVIFSNGYETKDVINDITEPFVNIQNGMCLYCASTNSIISFDNFNGMRLDSIEFDENIIGMHQSPDQSILLILTSQLNFFIVTNDLQILSEFELEQSGFGTAEPLAIGWGDKKTQFHGKIGKEARTFIEQANNLSEFDNKKPIVSWKEDGEYFAVSWISSSKIQTDAMSGTRAIRIFSSGGELFSTFEPVNALENGLFWRTKSNLIAASCRTNKGLEIAFFEKNGLRHGGFVLYDYGNHKQKYVTSIGFNSSDDICAVAINNLEKNLTHVDLFTTNNYHWYLKQTIVYDCFEEISLFWSMDRLHLCSQSGNYLIYDWYSEVDRSVIDNYSGEDQSIKLPNLVAVIDGNKVLMTPFEYCVIPPPYSAFTLNFPVNVIFVSLPVIRNISDNSLSCFVQISDYTGYWLNLTRDSVNNLEQEIIETKLQFGKAQFLYNAVVIARKKLDVLINSIHWVNNNSFYCVMRNELYHYTIDNGQMVEKKIAARDIQVAKICFNTHLYVQDVLGNVYKLEDDNFKFMFKYSTFCSEIYVASMKSEIEDVIFSLSSTLKQFYINGAVQPGSYLSILLNKNHLICTNVNQKLRCINLLDNNLKDLIQFFDEKNYKCDFDFDETFRLIESGTEIVTCVPADSKIVLMMPRGNLETIYPRGLVLDDLKRLMNNYQYSDALEKMRKQRVNLNLLYDHNPKTFIENLSNLVNVCKNNDRLILFVSELSKEDVTETIYKRFYNNIERSLQSQEKINDVCQGIVNLLEKEINDNNINLILTCFAKMIPSRTDRALQLLQQFKENGKPKIWEKGLKYLQYLISIDDLYRLALSTYDLNLTLQVAQKTQLDPKEYVMFINGLRELPCEDYRCYQINIFLKKFSLALEFIVKVATEHWDETLELIKNHKLYVKALELFIPGTEHYNIISASFANHIIENSSDLKSAGYVYLRTNDPVLCKDAATCFFKSLNWKEWLISCKKSQMDLSERNKNLVMLVVRLKDVGRFNEAVFICESHLKDFPMAFDTALDGRLFIDALRIMDLVEDETKEEMFGKLKKNIITYHGLLMDQLYDIQKKYENNVNRLVVVRMNFIKQYKEQRFSGQDEVLPDYMSDTTSETGSSTSSKHSGYSKMSSSSNTSKFRLKKKKVKKQWSDKEGTQKEEVGLIENLYLSITHVQSLIGDINKLIDALNYISKVQESRLLLESLNKLLKIQSESVSKIWDAFLVDVNLTIHENNIQISNHISVCRAPEYLGRRRFLLDEPFLKSAPKMDICQINCVISDIF